ECAFFFFQAEDGIRDDLVTGVQTCALPILKSALRRRQFRVLAGMRLREKVEFPRLQDYQGSTCPSCPAQQYRWQRELPCRGRPRSEERRVGREGASSCEECERFAAKIRERS